MRARGPDPGMAVLEPLLTDDPGPCALLYRPGSGDPDAIEVLAGDAFAVDELAALPAVPEGRAATPGGFQPYLLALLPYRQISERGFACRDDGAPIVGLRVSRHASVPLAQALARIPDVAAATSDVRFDVEDDHYAAIVRRVIDEEIGQGMGSNFVIMRSFTARIRGYTPLAALAFFARLLRGEQGTYWTFLVHTGERTFVGATPERHVALSGGRVSMNPISGTHRHLPGGPSKPELLRFLGDGKETDELYMVVDEELKMMGRLCPHGARVRGPYLREMARVTHTEYVLEGESDLDVRDTLRETMFAPTVTGSPLENACRVIARHEPIGRGYYSGVVALVGRDGEGRQALDSVIAIRTAEIDRSGRVRIGVGATLVRHSDPASEVEETRAKAATLRAALLGERADGAVPSPVPAPAEPSGLGTDPEVRRLLARRNAHLAKFWFQPPRARKLGDQALRAVRALVIDGEDTFTAMLFQQLEALGLRITVLRYDEPGLEERIEDFDAVLVGPGPGDPRDPHDARIATLRRVVEHLLDERIPFVAECLGHQVLARRLGLNIVRKALPSQGQQREIDLFGISRRVGCYNTFTARSESDTLIVDDLDEPVAVCRDADTGEVHALQGAGFASAQFHLESVLTEHGPELLGHMFAHALGTVVTPAPPQPTVPAP